MRELGILLIVLGIIALTRPVTETRYAMREEVAVVALKVLHGRVYQPPPATGEIFADMTDPNYWGTKWAEQAYRDGLFVGCGEKDGKPMFCPGGN